MAQDYWRADQAEEIVKEYMSYHPDLVGAKIACVFKEKATKKDGRPIVGKITKCTNKYKPLMDREYDYIITIGADAWADLSDQEREAWIDHLMEHAYGKENENSGEMTWKLRNPEFLGFPNVVNRHGLNWMPGLEKVASLDVEEKRKRASSDEDSSDDTSSQQDDEDAPSYNDLM